jgi:hypothetical protein
MSSDWISQYNAAVARVDPNKLKPKVQGPHCCSVCCAVFSLFAALFLFGIASLMKIDYPYMHMEGDLQGLSIPVTYAGVFYLACSIISLFFWCRGMSSAIPLRPTGRPLTFEELK